MVPTTGLQNVLTVPTPWALSVSMTVYMVTSTHYSPVSVCVTHATMILHVMLSAIMLGRV